MRVLNVLSIAQSLKVEINNRRSVLGNSQSGSDWCLKALHPSDPLTEVRGIPDRSAVPSVLMNYQATYTLTPPASATTTWEFNSSLLPHPLAFMYWARGVAGSMVDEGNFMNPQVPGATHTTQYVAFTELAQRWRLAYMSVTVYQDAPALSDQGTIVVSQPPVEGIKVSYSCPNASSGGILLATSPMQFYTAEDYPLYTLSQSMPNAYFGQSKYGAYVPLKLTETCQQWTSTEGQVVPCQTVPLSGSGRQYWLPFSAGNPFPFPTGITGGHGSWSTSGSTGTVEGDATSPMLNGSWAHICAKNLSVNTSYSFFIRCGIEMQVSPNSTLAPQLKLSPPHDDLALESYFAISRELKDAYPADYNDLGKIWDVISDVAKEVLPLVRMIGPYGKAVSTAGNFVVGAGDNIRNRRKLRKQQKKAKGKSPIKTSVVKVESSGEPVRGRSATTTRSSRRRAASR